MITKRLKNRHNKRPWTYRELRFNWTLVITVALIVTCNPLLMVLSHPLASVFWDWWFYMVKGARESTRLPQKFFEQRQVTAQEVDQYTDFVVKTKRIAFGLAFAAGTIGIAIKNSNFLFAFWGIFYSGTFLSIATAIALKVIKMPYEINIIGFNYPNHSSDLSSSTSINTRYDDPFKNYHDLSNLGNTLGFFNSSSPNYINRYLN